MYGIYYFIIIYSMIITITFFWRTILFYPLLQLGESLSRWSEHRLALALGVRHRHVGEQVRGGVVRVAVQCAERGVGDGDGAEVAERCDAVDGEMVGADVAVVCNERRVGEGDVGEVDVAERRSVQSGDVAVDVAHDQLAGRLGRPEGGHALRDVGAVARAGRADDLDVSGPGAQVDELVDLCAADVQRAGAGEAVDGSVHGGSGPE